MAGNAAHLREVSNDDRSQPSGQPPAQRGHGKAFAWLAAGALVVGGAGAGAGFSLGRVTAPVPAATQTQANPAVAAEIVSKAFADGRKLQTDADKGLLDAKDQVIAADQQTIRAKNDEIGRDVDQIKTLIANNQKLAERKCVVQRTKAWGGLTSDMKATCG